MLFIILFPFPFCFYFYVLLLFSSLIISLLLGPNPTRPTGPFLLTQSRPKSAQNVSKSRAKADIPATTRKTRPVLSYVQGEHHHQHASCMQAPHEFVFIKQTVFVASWLILVMLSSLSGTRVMKPWCRGRIISFPFPVW